MAEIFIHLNLCSLLKKSSLLTFIKYFCHVYNINISNYIYDENSFWPMIYFFWQRILHIYEVSLKRKVTRASISVIISLFFQYALRAENVCVCDLSTRISPIYDVGVLSLRGESWETAVLVETFSSIEG